MRAAPLVAWFHENLDLAVTRTTLFAGLPTPARRASPARTPESAVRGGLLRAVDVPFATGPWRAADLLGNGQRVRADDTVPFAVRSAARHPGDLTSALWATAEGFGDVDTTCAITGGVVAARTGLDGVPQDWLRRREPLPGPRPGPGI
ncbi:ADP-ribosylglycohydrolase family protein [Streptomyces sp. NPDC002276]